VLVKPIKTAAVVSGAEKRGPVLVVAGSRSPATVRQVEAAAQAGMVVIQLSPENFRIVNRLAIIANNALGVLERGENVIISTTGLGYQPGAEELLAHALGELAARILHRGAAGGVVLTGGDTAAAVCRAVNCRVLLLGGEVLPGMVWGSMVGGIQPGLSVVTKAGGFGDELALVRAVQFLS
jgi:D-threonate/D-erythronate kinase